LSGDWKALARQAGFRVSNDNSIVVRLDGGSSQTVYADDSRSDEALRCWTVIATAKTLNDTGADSSFRYAWERNRFSDLVGFDIDPRGRLIGETWIPLVGLMSQELALHIREVARVSDWHEFRLTGADQY
jgi:hypothetical protein